MKIDNFGRVFITTEEAFRAVYAGKIIDLAGLYLEDNAIAKQFNHSIQQNADTINKTELLNDVDLTTEEFDKANQQHWFMPKDYCPNLVEILYDMCTTDEQINRVSEELELFIQHNMMDLLHYLKYLVDTMRQNNIVWGVGRGSSVSSYVLYLLGVHKIDSLKYNLDINEFLK